MLDSIIVSQIILVLVASVVSSARAPEVSNLNKCILPKHPANGKWVNKNHPGLSPEEEVESGFKLKVTCNRMYSLKGSRVITCRNGNWNSKIGKCLELCPPVTEESTIQVNCTTDGKTSSCSKPMTGTIATIQCKPFYENADLNRNPFRICKNREWNEEIPSCTPICGDKQEITQNNSKESFYPWNVAIYERQINGENLFAMKCVGTLINEKTILTAAGCITNTDTGTLNLFEDYKLAAGKFYSDPISEEDVGAQFSQVKDMFVPSDYRGKLTKYIADIAVIIASDPFNMTKRIQPACLDWTEKFKKEIKFPKTQPSIAGRMTTAKTDIKKILKISLLNETCRDCKPSPNWYEHVAETADKYVSDYEVTDIWNYNTSNNIFNTGYINTSCKMDVGVGLVTKNPFNRKYYLIGVLRHYSLPEDGDYCYKGLTTYTKVYDYISDFIVEKANLYTTINRAHFQTSCGIKSVQAQTLIVEGDHVEKSDYPWQVAIYKINDATKTLICGGSLINQRVILTAAHCVATDQGKKQKKEKFIVAVGKYYRNFDDNRDNNAQFSMLSKIIISNKYAGESQNYLGDIAILISKNSFNLTKEVQPICVDWDANYEQQFLQPNVTGFVAGWGFTQENYRPSEELQQIEVPYVEREECKNTLPSNYEIFLTADKLCAGFLKKGKSVCKGDSGGGLVFKNKNDDRYYLGGIVSISPQAPSGGCNSQLYSLYTRVSVYIKNFILEHARLYWA